MQSCLPSHCDFVVCKTELFAFYLVCFCMLLTCLQHRILRSLALQHHGAVNRLVFFLLETPTPIKEAVKVAKKHPNCQNGHFWPSCGFHLKLWHQLDLCFLPVFEFQLVQPTTPLKNPPRLTLQGTEDGSGIERDFHSTGTISREAFLLR